MTLLSDQLDSVCVSTAMASLGACPQCGARTMQDPDGEFAACLECLFRLALDNETGPATAVEEPVATKGGSVLGPFEILEEIGRGGMGVIYRARRIESGEVVAIKTLSLPHEGAAEARTRFERETRIAKAISHPHFMPIHEVCLNGPRPYFCMDLAPGGSLAELLPKYRGRWRQAMLLMKKVAGAVQHAHEMGLIHRDLKPGNILFTEEFEPQVCDFGLAKWLDEDGADLTRSLVMFGTPNYVAPEQAAGKNRELTPAADIYSLGAILFELLAGRPPYIGDSPLDVLQQAMVGPAPRLRSIVPTLPGELDAICARCLEVRPADRYASAEALAADIGRWLCGERVVTRSSFRGRVRARFGSKRWLAVGAVSFLGIASVGAAYRWQKSYGKDVPSVIAPAVTLSVDDLSTGGELAEFSERLGSALGPVVKVTHLSAENAGGGADSRVSAGDIRGAQVALHASVRREGAQVRVVSTLFDLGLNRQIKARIDSLPVGAKSSEFLVLGTALRADLMAALNTRSMGQPGRTPMNTEAAACCETALEFFHRCNAIDNDHAIALFERSLEVDPGNVPALAGLTNALRFRYSWWGGDPRDLARALEIATTALAADPLAAEAHHAMGVCLLAARRFAEAREEFLREIELNPTSAGGCANISICCRELGDPGCALPWISRATRLDPMHGSLSTLLGDICMVAGDDTRAERELRHASVIDPEHGDALNSLVILELWQGRRDEAVALCRELVARFPNNQYRDQVAAEIAFFTGNIQVALAMYTTLAAAGAYEDRIEFFGAINPASAVASLLQTQGRPGEAACWLNAAEAKDRELLAKLPSNPRILHDLAAIAALRGERGRALELLSAASAAGWIEIRSTTLDPRFESLRDGGRVQGMVAQAPEGVSGK